MRFQIRETDQSDSTTRILTSNLRVGEQTIDSFYGYLHVQAMNDEIDWFFRDLQ